jgi:hypothetical protein|tara:strand:- start:507 stop:1100 length:594 start_codon:yes stop_codon:yes gene_type:complete
MSQTTNISEIGEAIYPHLNKPDVRFSEAGEYKVTLKVAKSDATEMLKLYTKAIDDSLKLAEQNQKGKGIKNAPKPFTEEDNFVFFKFKMKATGVNQKTKEKFSQRPQLFDAKKNPIPLSTIIWGGSKMRVAFNLVPYYTPMLGAGITARLKAVQVISLVEGKDSNLFSKEDGYEATPEPKAEVISNETSEVQESKDF